MLNRKKFNVFAYLFLFYSHICVALSISTVPLSPQEIVYFSDDIFKAVVKGVSESSRKQNGFILNVHVAKYYKGVVHKNLEVYADGGIYKVGGEYVFFVVDQKETESKVGYKKIYADFEVIKAPNYFSEKETAFLYQSCDDFDPDIEFPREYGMRQFDGDVQSSKRCYSSIGSLAFLEKAIDEMVTHPERCVDGSKQETFFCKFIKSN